MPKLPNHGSLSGGCNPGTDEASMNQALIIGFAILFAVSWILVESFCGAILGIIAAKYARKRLGK